MRVYYKYISFLIYIFDFACSGAFGVWKAIPGFCYFRLLSFTYYEMVSI